VRIAHIGSRGLPGVTGGIERGLEEICPRLVARGHEVTVYCSDRIPWTEPTWRGVRLERVPALHTKHLETISRTFLATLRARREPFDVVHFHAIGPSLLAGLARRPDRRTFVTVQGLDWQREKWGSFAKGVLKLAERASARLPDHTIVVSQHLQRHYAAQHGCRTLWIPNGVTCVAPRKADAIQARFGLSRGEYVLFASRLVPEKGCHTLIEAFRRLDSDKKLVIAGGSWYSDDYVAELQRAAAGAHNVLFVGWASGDLLTELFSNAYLYCLPSQIEGLSLSLLEAMSFGRCALVSDIPENLEVVEDAGACFAVGDAGALAARLEELLTEPPLVERLGGAARRLVVERYDWERVVDALEAAYRDALQPRAPSTSR
jgi:glycosyltransferase involved in cell wall biosynthesis